MACQRTAVEHGSRLPDGAIGSSLLIITGRFTAYETFSVDLFTTVNTEASLDEVQRGERRMVGRFLSVNPDGGVLDQPNKPLPASLQDRHP